MLRGLLKRLSAWWEFRSRMRELDREPARIMGETQSLLREIGRVGETPNEHVLPAFTDDGFTGDLDDKPRKRKAKAGAKKAPRKRKTR